MKASRAISALATIVIGLAIPLVAIQPAAADSPTTLRQEAAQQGIIIGSGAINPDYLDEPQFAQVLADQFNSLSPENELKWEFNEPQQGVFDFSRLDKLVDFAQAHNMKMKGHGLISGCCNPPWLEQITDAAQLKAAMATHFNALMQRYAGKVDRWDVMTEPFSTFGGTGLEHNFFYNVLGPDYIAEAFRIAHAADPSAKLFINESLVESYPAKRQELYDLVSSLVAQGVPINGVGLEMHETLAGPPPGVITDMVKAYKALGLDVAITELDVHTYDPVSQAQIYGDIVSEALKAGIKDINTWGFTDEHAYTWLPGAKPLMFDESFNPKPAYFAVHDALHNFVSDASGPELSGLPGDIVNESDGLNLGVTASDPESGVASLTAKFNGVDVPATGAVSLAGLAGERTLTVTAVNNVGLTTTASKTILVVPTDHAAAQPSRATLSNTSGWANGLHDGYYSINMDLWGGTPGSVYRLYENDALISTEILGADAAVPQHATTAVDGKPNGTYTYRAVLINSKGSTTSTATTVKVTDANPGKPVVSDDNWDHDGNFTATANLWWGTNANSYTFSLDGVPVSSGSLAAHTPAAQTASVSLSGVREGTHSLTVSFANAYGSTTSDPVQVVVR
ncbi:endo-1,4-beta-xylanase [Leifsonia poae]|uniref:endo-1,4-beta-xylanase n=1 Tax=Leifsonia poae TaxID=110933 RepID=UPI001CBB5CD6|nr:endo-1,4-beta-xylanase [Leifsonia poae]